MELALNCNTVLGVLFLCGTGVTFKCSNIGTVLEGQMKKMLVMCGEIKLLQCIRESSAFMQGISNYLF